MKYTQIEQTTKQYTENNMSIFMIIVAYAVVQLATDYFDIVEQSKITEKKLRAEYKKEGKIV